MAVERSEEEEGQWVFQGCVLTENRSQGPDCQAAATLCEAILPLKFSLQETRAAWPRYIHIGSVHVITVRGRSDAS